MDNEITPARREEDYKYNIYGKCPRCAGKLLPAKFFYVEPVYKKAAKCFACSRIWEWNKKAEEISLMQ